MTAPNHPGLAFEKAVAQVQAQFDAGAKVTHNEQIVDRHGHSRQFDVVIRGKFAGQQLLGIIECKDTKAKVGTPEVDAFVTKSGDVNANVRMLMSRRGFTKPALEKCAHHGIQALSLLGHDSDKVRVRFLGTRWQADVYRWGRISVTLRFVEEPTSPISFRAEELSIDGKRVLDWFLNYLLDHKHEPTDLGWIVGIGVEFSRPQKVQVTTELARECRAIEFHAERVCDKYERMAPLSGTGFYDWHAKKATFVPGSEIRTEPVPMNFTEWDRASSSAEPPGFLNVRFVAEEISFERVSECLDLDAL